MSNLLTPQTQLIIKKHLQDVIDTFFTWPVILNLRTTTVGLYGEKPQSIITHRTFECLVDLSVGKSGRYQDIAKSEMGQRDEEAFHIYFWADDIINSGIVLDAESDTISLNGIPSIPNGEYEIRLWVPAALFSNLGFLLYDMEIKMYGG